MRRHRVDAPGNAAANPVDARALPIPHGISFANPFTTLTGIDVVTYAVIATFLRERFGIGALTHWNETLVMAAPFS
jgi:hypothetical protein